MADVDVIHGHSSHHAKGIEVYQDKLIIYGCGDFLNDYEGISGHEQFRGDLSLMYFASLDPASGQLMALQMMPMQMKRFQLHKAAQSDGVWLKQVLDRQGKQFGTSVSLEEGDLRLNWREADG
jgi:poly-gamma-glutamate synthesis protein (capsule biosynthesis protein)